MPIVLEAAEHVIFWGVPEVVMLPDNPPFTTPYEVDVVVAVSVLIPPQFAGGAPLD
jgi:hypothetical protein